MRPLIGDDLPLSTGPDTVLGATGTARLRRLVFASHGIVWAFPSLFRFVRSNAKHINLNQISPKLAWLSYGDLCADVVDGITASCGVQIVLLNKKEGRQQWRQFNLLFIHFNI